MIFLRNLRNLFPYLGKRFRNNSVKCISTHNTLFTSYDADGKTTVNIVNDNAGMGIMINSYSQNGFRLNNGMYAIGPIAIFPHTVLGWNVEGDDDINEDSLSLFRILEPKLDILIVGYGGTVENRKNFNKTILSIMHKKKLNIEVLPTEKAVSTFNFLNSESRFVAAALIPPAKISVIDEDLSAARLRKLELYGEEK